MTELPLVSCVITAYNYGDYVAGAIESALAQDYPADRLEVVVIDDGSTDHTAEEAARFGDRIRLIRQDNAGVIAATNRGIAEASGELIALLDADDEWLPHKVSAQVARFARPEVGLVYGNMELMDGAGVTRYPDHFAAHGVAPATGAALGPLMLRNLACTATIMVRRSLAHTFWPLPPNMWCQDWWTAVRVAAVAEVDCVPEPVTRYRIHAQNRSSHGNQDAKFFRTQAGDVAFRRWMLRHLDLDGVESRHLEPAWATFLKQLAAVCKGLRRRPADLLAVTPEDRRRALARVAEAREAEAAGDLPRA
ncbi:MAG TPA: glycosyltransferase, partial [Solirubrobacteraceae bacterium]|nr:glycosyltransferase [Solirubrobacteraceae bacterium]